MVNNHKSPFQNIIFTKMLELLRSILQYNCGITTYRPVVIGVSGGPDSLVLLDVMNKLGYSVIVAHLNHLIRPQGKEEAAKVDKLADERGLAYVYDEVDVPAYAKTHSLSMETAAREIRYQFLFKLATERNAQAVLVGHTADDQIETMLLHLLRGTGLAGLRGMSYSTLPNPWSQSIPLVRPLLSIWRSEVLEYINEHTLKPNEDLSNLDVSYLRNRVRHELIPILETYNPGIRKLLWRTAEIVKGDLSILEHVTDQAWESCLTEIGESYLCFRIQEFLNQVQGVQRYLLIRGIRKLHPGSWDIDFATVERGLQFITSAQSGSQSELIHGLKLIVEPGRLWMTGDETKLPTQRDWPQLITPQEVNFDLPGRLVLSSGWELGAASTTLGGVENSEEHFRNADPYTIWVDADQLAPPLVVRGRKSGDSISPLGMGNSTIKISDLMINLKIPSRARGHWPIVCDQQGVIWVPGMRMCHRVRVRSNTKQIIHFSVLQTLKE